MFKIKIILAFIIFFIITGCSAIPVDRYHVTADNQLKIKTLKQDFNVGRFTATKTGFKIQCRLANHIKMTDGKSFEGYIQNALEEELKMASMYSENSKIIIEGHLNDIDVSSNPDDAHWTLNLTISNLDGQNFTIVHKREYDASFAAQIACGIDMPRSFASTVQELIGKIVNHPEFDSVFSE